MDMGTMMSPVKKSNYFEKKKKDHIAKVIQLDIQAIQAKREKYIDKCYSSNLYHCLKSQEPEQKNFTHELLSVSRPCGFCMTITALPQVSRTGVGGIRRGAGQSGIITVRRRLL